MEDAGREARAPWCPDCTGRLPKPAGRSGGLPGGLSPSALTGPPRDGILAHTEIPVTGRPRGATRPLAALPPDLAHRVAAVKGWGLVPVAIAPLVGHVWRSVRGLRGDKAVTVTFGMWSGLTLWEAYTGLGVLLILRYTIPPNEGRSSMLGLIALPVVGRVMRAEPAVLCLWAANLAVLTWTHRAESRSLPGPRPWVCRALGRRR